MNASPQDEPGSFARPTAPTLVALTLQRPWAWAISHSSKRVENRTWTPPSHLVGSYLAIHAGKTWDEDGADTVAILTRCMPVEPSEHPLGIVAVARLARVIDCARDDVPEDQERWACGPYAWLLEDVVALPELVTAAGHQGLWPVTGEALLKVREGYRRGRRNAGRVA